NIGLAGADVTTLAINPQNPAILYAGTYGGIYKSVDGSATWAFSSRGLVVDPEGYTGFASTEKIIVDPQTPSTVYAATLDNIYRSTDGGANWSLLSGAGLPAFFPVYDLAHTVSAPASTLFAGSADGVYSSSDGGATWSKGVGLPNLPVYALAPSLSQPSVLYGVAGFSTGDVYRSADEGATWSKVAGVGLPAGSAALVVSSEDAALLYALASGKLYRSADSGASWAQLTIPTSYASSLALSSLAPRTLYVAGSEGFYRSDDEGATWFSQGGEAAPTALIVADPTNPNTLYGSSYGGTVRKSTDRGASWNLTDRGFTAPRIDVLLADRVTPTTLYSSTPEEGFVRSLDGGSTWEHPPGSLVYNANTLVQGGEPSSPTLYAGTYGDVYASTDGGTIWSQRSSGLPSSAPVLRLATNPLTPTTLYAGLDGGPHSPVYRSDNGGLYWLPSDAGLPNHRVEQLTIDPATPTTLYARTRSYSGTQDIDSLYRTIDGGASWASIAAGLPTSLNVSAFALDPQRPSTLYAVANYGLYRSTDAGTTWAFLTNGRDERASGWPYVSNNAVLLVDPSESNTIYVGSGGGIARSTNGGLAWSDLNADLPSDTINTIALGRATSTTPPR
ncbi:MAG: hypothetical protein H7Y32_03355, partial [Chloroflexales bacterium]|nr:hypothetical protein [Chloroflexales bacterium]